MTKHEIQAIENFGQKTIDCLKYASMSYDPYDKSRKEMGLLTMARKQYYEIICKKYSEKDVLKKLKQLANKEYCDYGIGEWGSWLTEKGKHALEYLLKGRSDQNKQM